MTPRRASEEKQNTLKPDTVVPAELGRIVTRLDEIGANIKPVDLAPVIKAIEAIEIPPMPEMPEMPEVHKVQLEGVSVVAIKGDKGDKGDKGEAIIGPPGRPGPTGPKPVLGEDYTVKDGRDGKDGKDSTVPGPQGRPGRDGKDGSPDTAQEIVAKLQSLRGDERLDESAIKGLKELILDYAAFKKDSERKLYGFIPHPAQTWYRENVGGTIDGSNTTFTLAHSPAHPDSLHITLGRQPQIQGLDYTLFGFQIIYTTPPSADLANEPHIAQYQ